jgi:hypothetical protein
MIHSIFVCYLFKINKGSEWLLGENIYRILGRGSYMITANHQIQGDLCCGAIGHFKYMRKNGRISVIGMFGSEIEPTTPMSFRLDYLIWSLRVYSLLKKRIARRKVYHNNFAQVLTPIPKPVRESKNFSFGPVGGQGPWYKVRFLPFKNRVVNYIIFDLMYGAITSHIRRMNPIFVHPLLAERFKCGQIKPAIQLKREPFLPHKKRPRVLHVSRRVYFKLPDLHRQLFENLSIRHPELDFFVVGAGWGQTPSSRNLHFFDSLPRDEIMMLFAQSQFHINLSLELAGIVNLEAALNKCITIGSTNSGSEFLLGLRDKYVIDIYNPHISINGIINKISKTISYYDESEAERQYAEANKHTFIAC